MNEKGRKRRGERGGGEAKLMAQGNPLHYTCFKGIISARILQGLRVDTSTPALNISWLKSLIKSTSL